MREIADIDPQHGKSHQHARRVGDVDIVLRRLRPIFAIKGRHHIVKSLQLKVMKGAMPPHVAGEYAAFLPSFFVLVDPLNAV